MSKRKSKSRRLLEEKIQANKEQLYNSEDDNPFLEAMAIDFGIKEEPVHKTKKTRNKPKYPSRSLSVKVDLNSINEEDVLSLLDFKKSTKKEDIDQEKKLKILNLLVHKTKDLKRLVLEKYLISNLTPLLIEKDTYDNIIEKIKVKSMNEIENERLIKTALIPYFISNSNQSDKRENYTLLEKDRAYKVLKYYYDINNTPCENKNSKEYVKIKIREDIIKSIDIKLDEVCINRG